jgi:hypothetical protein
MPVRIARKCSQLPKLHIRAGERVIAVHDGGVEGRHQRGMKEVEEVRDRRSKPLDLQPVDRVDMADDLLGSVATRARVEEPPNAR